MTRSAIDRLQDIMRRLRDPDRGCPWDVEQTFASIAPYTIEEAYEVADAIARDDMADLKEELGDLLLQVVYHSAMAEEAGHFNLESVAAAIADKMIRRHPHVFSDAPIDSATAQRQAWENIKAEERRRKREVKRPSLLDDIPATLPALTRAQKLQARAARGGFDWRTVIDIFDKVEEEINELKAEIEKAAEPVRIEEELGDVLFVLANLARRLGLDSEQAGRAACRKFERRFRAMEQALAERPCPMIALSLEELEQLWQEIKAKE